MAFLLRARPVALVAAAAIILSVLVTAPAHASGSVGLTINNWVMEPSTGATTYNLTLNGSGLGAVDAPCPGTASCYWHIEGGADLGSGMQVVWTGISGSSAYIQWTISANVAKANVNLPEITHLRARVYRSGGNPEVSTGWISVPTQPDGNVDLHVEQWQFDPATGNTTYDVTLQATGMGGWDEPCPGTATCYWRIEGGADLGSGMQVVWYGPSGSSAYRLWTINANRAQANINLPEITHLRARVYRSGGTPEVSTGWFDISDGVVHGIHASLYVGLLQARGAGMAELCEYVYLTPQPDATPHTSTDSGDELCLAAEAGQMSLAQLVIDLVVVLGSYEAAQEFLNDATGSTGTRRFDEIRRAAPAPSGRYKERIVEQTEELEAEPKPEVAAAGAGIPLPPRCIDDATYFGYLDTRWNDHHLATDKQALRDAEGSIVRDANGRALPGGFTERSVDLLDSFDMLSALDPQGRWWIALNQSWNIVSIPHIGSHADRYHQWVLGNLQLALERANGDVDLFQKLFREYVAKPVLADPTVVREAWWACQP